MKFDYQGWFFLKPSELEKTKNGIPTISLKMAQQKALRFQDIAK